MKLLLALEFLALAASVAILFVIAGFSWWWLFVLFLVFDVSAVGYIVNPKMGAITYNIGHSIITPLLLLGIYFLHRQSWELLVALAWLFHIFVDRAVGYGLKYSDDFKHTHLGSIGKNKV